MIPLSILGIVSVHSDDGLTSECDNQFTSVPYLLGTIVQEKLKFFFMIICLQPAPRVMEWL